MSLIEHDKDFFLWTRQQAEALRRLAEARPNGEVDWPNLIEEIDLEPRRHWMVEIDAQRGSLERRLRMNPSLRARSDELLAEAWRLASRQLKLQFGRGSAIPTDCPFTLAQLLNDDWFPETPAGDGSVG
jgi:hypothetical protein